MGMIYAPPSIIQNGALINNVCHIYQSTRPTTRPDGSALVAGDIWYNPLINTPANWNNLNWVGSHFFLISPGFSASTTTNELGSTFFPVDTSNLLLESWGFVVRQELGTFDDSNYWDIQPRFRWHGSNSYPFPAITPIRIDTGAGLYSTIYRSNSINTVIDLTSGYRNVIVNATRTGTPPNMNNSHFWVKCRGVL